MMYWVLSVYIISIVGGGLWDGTFVIQTNSLVTILMMMKCDV